MSAVKRERWTETDIDALPPGEHDYFERKSGLLFLDRDALLGKLAKAISAMANSGGGHIIAGVTDDGVPDGVPLMQGKTTTRDWLEQVVPRLVNYPLSDFRVHVVERGEDSRIPPDRPVIVVDVGDSALAPHQCARAGADATEHVYYHRQGGRSVPAPHFYLELLRHRLVGASLEATPSELLYQGAAPGRAGGLFVAFRLAFGVRNVGRVAAYKWALRVVQIDGHDEARRADYEFDKTSYPSALQRDGMVIRSDETILPDCTRREEVEFGIVLRAFPRTPDNWRVKSSRPPAGSLASLG